MQRMMIKGIVVRMSRKKIRECMVRRRRGW